MQPPWPAVFRAPPTKEVLMTTLREKMMQDLKLAGYAVKTQRTYLDAIGDLAKFCWSPAELGQEQVRDWVERLTKSKVGPQRLRQHFAALSAVPYKNLRAANPCRNRCGHTLLLVSRSAQSRTCSCPSSAGDQQNFAKSPIASRYVRCVLTA